MGIVRARAWWVPERRVNNKQRPLSLKVFRTASQFRSCFGEIQSSLASRSARAQRPHTRSEKQFLRGENTHQATMLLALCSPTPITNRRANVVCLARKESWREADSITIMGKARSPAKDAGSEDDDYTTLDLEVISRATAALQARRGQLERVESDAGENLGSDADALVKEGLALQSARQGDEAEKRFLAALAASRSCGAAWYGLGSLLHEYQHGGLSCEESVNDDDEWIFLLPEEQADALRQRRLSRAADCALIAARYEPGMPRALALLGDVLNDMGEHREACRAWTSAEARGARHWRSLTAPWLDRARDAYPLSAFGPREPLRSLAVGDEPVTMARESSGRAFTARRLADKPAAFLLSGFSTSEEREAIVAAGLASPMREVPRAEEDAAADDDRRGCEVAWLESPLTAPDTPWANLMRDAAQAVLPGDASPHVPGAGALEDLHVVKYAKGGAYGLHLDATCAVPRAVTVLHYLNDVMPEDDTAPGFCGETWLPLADADESLGPPRYGSQVAGEDGVLVPARAGDALVFFSFTDLGEVDAQSLHGGRPASQVKVSPSMPISSPPPASHPAKLTSRVVVSQSTLTSVGGQPMDAARSRGG